jgi:membrane protease YdiL (CAAX protease family)
VIAAADARGRGVAGPDPLTPIAVGMLVLALATRPVTAVGLAVIVGAGVVALVPRLALPARGVGRSWVTWAAPLAIGVAGFAVARLSVVAPFGAFRPWVALGSVVAAVAEEAVFRRLVYGWALRWGVPLAIVVSAILFAAIHVPVYGAGVFWIDLGAGLVLSWQRWASGGWAVPAVTHSAANLLQFL